MGEGGQIWLKCITGDLIMMIRDKNNIFERVENFHADLAWNYPVTFIIPVLFPLLVREYSDFPFRTFGLMGASPENGHTPHGQRSAFQSFNGGGVVHFFFKCNRNIIDIKRCLHLMTRTQKHLYRQNITVLSRHIIWNIQI